MKRERKKHKVLFLNTGGGIGGSSKFLYYLLRSINRNKFDPSVAYYFYNDGFDTRQIRELGVPVFFIKDKREPADYVPVKCLLGNEGPRILHRIKVPLRLLLRIILVEYPLIRELQVLIKKEAIDLVVLNNDVHYHIAGVVGSKIAGLPCICRKAGGIGEGKGIKKLLTRWVDLFIAISAATANDQLKNNPSTKKRLVTILEGVDLKLYHPNHRSLEARKKLGIGAGEKVIGSISRFDRGKGQTELLQVANLIARDYPEAVFLFVGDGDLLAELQALTGRLNLTDSVRFLGWRNDIIEILSAIDIFVHCPTTRVEGLGIANLEAMAMGKPSVVSDNGGLPDAVVDNVTGFVVPPGNIEKLSGAIIKLLTDESLVGQFGKNARKRAEEKFDIEKNVRKMEDLFAIYI